jgi:diguanylate cyclase (GGDEF)-like protein
MNVLPYGFLVGAYLLLVRRYSYPLPMGFSPLAAGVGAVIAMVLLRQYITLHENDKLNRQQKEAMESAHQQAVELENANQALQAEISERQRMQQQLAFEAMHDWLTGLPNRFLLMERLGQALALTRQNPKYSFAVLFMDLDQFKVINDSLGHPVGDQLLNTCLRNEDTLSRFGGDEFIFLLDKSGEDEVLLVSNRIMEILKPPFILDGHEVFTTASIGIVSNGQNYEHPEDILRDADIAMYRAKSLGKARSEIFKRDLREQAFHRLELERNLRQAVEKQEFCLDYQPVFTLATQQMIGFEALIRWNHPLRGQLMPDDFIHVAEETGLILPIGAWVLDTACAWLKQNRQANPHLPALRIHVNISAQQLASPHFAEQIRQVLDTHGLEGRVLRLDVDEHTLVSSFPTSGTLFSWLRVMGVGLQINNFGTGYSSLGYLQRFPIQAIKIDRSFIHELDSSSQGLDILRAMLVMGQEMGIEIIAEGIERESQARILKELNCLYGQGNYFSAPLDSEAASQFLQFEAVSVTTP